MRVEVSLVTRRRMQAASPLIAVTGSTGFVGRALIHRLRADGTRIKQLTRSREPARATTSTAEGNAIALGPLESATGLQEALADVTTVVHLAGRAHVMSETVEVALAAYRATNVEGTRKLAMAASKAGVRRLIFVSSIKVNGERTTDEPFRATDEPKPEDAYGISKVEAEALLHEVADRTDLEICVMRPPLIYGPGVKGNFARLVGAVDKGMVLPLAAIDNRRSLVYVENLCDLIVRCIDHPAAAGKTFLVADDETLSTPELVARIGQAMDRPARLLHVPQRLLAGALTILGRRGEYERLAGSLVVDTTATRETLGWSPPFTVTEGLRRTVGR